MKDLGSKWEPGDRSGKWLKLKPDYIHAGADLDALIIGDSPSMANNLFGHCFVVIVLPD